ncbi:MAG: hypothetical protein IJC98_06045 [Clostridia bacterium]|nr:hypothetical protein [Clostridia bacterium]
MSEKEQNTDIMPIKERDNPPISESSDVGYLTVSTGTGGKAYPLSNVQIEIYLPNDDNEYSLYRRQTSDESGIAEAVPIPTPSPKSSLAPNSPYLPYTTVHVRVFRDGYYSAEAKEVPIFPGIRSLQYFDMIPLSKSEQYAEPNGELIIFSETRPNNL